MDTEDTQILVSVDVSDALHFNHELEMRAILGKDCRRRFNCGPEEP